MYSKLRWWLMGLAFVGISICYMDRAALAYAIEPIKLIFHLNNNQFGFLSSAFGLGYMLTMVFSGMLVDKYGARRIWGLAAFIWSLATLLIGLSSTFTILLFLRIILGVSESPSFPSLTRATTDWLPISERGTALSLGLAAVPFSSVIGAPICTAIIAKFNWQFMFFVLGGLGIVWSLAWILLFRNHPQPLQQPSKSHHHNKPIQTKYTILHILSSKTLLLNNYAFFAFGYLLFFGITWLPGYIVQTFHVDIARAGLFLILPWSLATIAILLCGFYMDRLWQKTKSLRISRSLIIGISMILSALFFLPAILIHNLYVDIISISFAIAIGLLPNSCFYALNADLMPEMAATSLAIMDAFFALAGIMAPIITGYFSNLTGNFEIAIAIMVALNISSGLLILCFQKPDKEHALPRDDRMAT